MIPRLALLLVLALPSLAFAKPDLVVFLSDDHGQRDSTPYGATDVRTPNMQRLADEGLTFTHAYVASPSCAPSRAALLTGLMPARNGAEANHSAPRDEFKKLPAYLQALGYEVRAFGKVGHYKQSATVGFDAWDPTANAEVVGKFLAGRDRTKPLCLFVGTNDPHVPWPPADGYDPSKLKLPPTFVDTPETRAMRAQYYTGITRADMLLGEVYDLARKHLDAKNTLVLYTSDHGAQWPFGKWNLYDAGVRVPMLAVWPGVIAPGTKTAAMVQWIDLLPTYIELAGGTPPANLDGRSFVKALRGEATEHRERIFTTHSGDGDFNVYPMRAVQTREWKYILNLHPEFKYTTHIDKAKEKDGLKYWSTWELASTKNLSAAALIQRYHERPKEELYDLMRDPHEQHNLAANPDHAERLAKFRGELGEWIKVQGDKQTVFGNRLLLRP